MKKILLLCGMLLALTATVASAAGINLGWNNCVGNGGVRDRTFACDTNSGDNIFVASVKAPAGMHQWVSFETYFEVQSDQADLPAWWRLRTQTGNPTQCRAGALTASADFTSAPYTLPACLDAYAGIGAGGLNSYANLTGSNHATCKTTFAVAGASAQDLTEDAEYYTARFRVTNVKTVGTGACADCGNGVCINLTLVRVLQPASANNNVSVSNEAENSHITFNNPTVATCRGATPTKSTTWGSVKALYR